MLNKYSKYIKLIITFIFLYISCVILLELIISKVDLPAMHLDKYFIFAIPNWLMTVFVFILYCHVPSTSFDLHSHFINRGMLGVISKFVNFILAYRNNIIIISITLYLVSYSKGGITTLEYFLWVILCTSLTGYIFTHTNRIIKLIYSLLLTVSIIIIYNNYFNSNDPYIFEFMEILIILNVGLIISLFSLKSLFGILNAELSSANFGKKRVKNKIKLDSFNCSTCSREFLSEIPNENLNLDSKIFDDFVLKLIKRKYDLQTRFKLIKHYHYLDIYDLQREKLREYIKFRNWGNLQISIILLVFSFLWILIYHSTNLINDRFITLVILFSLFRLISRTVEIIYSFGKDFVSRNQKSTNLTGSERIFLAIRSIIEVIITSYSIRLLLHTEEYTTSTFLYEFFIIFAESIAISFFNISFDNEYGSVDAILHLVQFLCSITLITLSIAAYINMPKYNTYFKLGLVPNRYFYISKNIVFNGNIESKVYLKAVTLEELSNQLSEQWKWNLISDHEYDAIKGTITDYKEHLHR